MTANNSNSPIQFRFTPTEHEDRLRIDKYLVENMQDISRSHIQYLIKNGHVKTADGSINRASATVKHGRTYYVEIPESQLQNIPPYQKDLNILFEDEHLIVLDKEAGITVHPGAGNHNDTLVNILMAHYGNNLSGIGGKLRPGIVHRLDKDTSGLMLVAKNDYAHWQLSNAIANRQVERKYIAIIWGVLRSSSGFIDLPISRNPKNRKVMHVNKDRGRNALTHYRTLKIFSNNIASLIECKLDTGRTHQIRVHLNHIGHSIIGDQTYGKRTRKSNIAFPRQALHSCYLSLKHPVTEKHMEFSTHPPEDMRDLIHHLS